MRSDTYSLWYLSLFHKTVYCITINITKTVKSLGHRKQSFHNFVVVVIDTQGSESSLVPSIAKSEDFGVRFFMTLP